MPKTDDPAVSDVPQDLLPVWLVDQDTRDPDEARPHIIRRGQERRDGVVQNVLKPRPPTV